MVDLEKIRLDIEALKNLTAEEYCREEVAKIYADFEASRASKVHDLETAIEIFAKYQVVEEPETNNDEVIEQNAGE